MDLIIQIVGLVSAVVGLIGFIIAVWQTRIALSQNKTSLEQTKEMRAIQTSLSTRYIGEFPHFVGEIIKVLETG